MAKFEVEMEIQGFKLRLKGDRNDDFPNLRSEIGKQLTGLLQPPANLLDDPVRKQVDSTVQETQESQNNGKNGTRKPTGRRRALGGKDGTAAPLRWQHDPGKWGMPKQAWTAPQKILWALYVIAKETTQTEVTAPMIAETFNVAFRQSGLLSKKHMTESLGRLKIKSPAQVMENTTVNPSAWFLTEEGIRESEKLVIEAKGGVVSPDTGT